MQNSAGLHLLIDAYVADPIVFERERLETMFAKLISALEMKPLDKAMFYEVDVDPEILERVKRTGHFEDEGGNSILQVITTSHLSAHTWPLQKFVSLDVFSCKTFNEKLALSIIHETLGIESFTVLTVERRKPDVGEQRTYQFVM